MNGKFGEETKKIEMKEKHLTQGSEKLYVCLMLYRFVGGNLYPL